MAKRSKKVPTPSGTPAAVPSPTQDVLCPRVTRKHGYRYVWTAKHHGGDPKAAQWIVTGNEEFSVFDTAVYHELADAANRLFGVLSVGGKRLRTLGAWGEQVAEFPAARKGRPWHGYPLWALDDRGPSNRRKERFRPTKEVLLKMQEVGLITEVHRIRLLKGDHA
jgi:hypothetical protein